MTRRVVFSKTFIDKAKSHNEAALRDLYNNYVDPLNKGYDVKDLPGKFKPSWELPYGCLTQTARAFAQFAQSENLFHYHVGYLTYKPGADPKYPGMVSDSIVHSKIQLEDGIDIHYILQLDETHPEPFSFPMVYDL